MKATKYGTRRRRPGRELLESRYLLSAVGFVARTVVEADAPSASSAYTADLDGDGDMDVLSASRENDTIGWFENLDGEGTFGSHQVITSQADGATSVHAADVDGDGDMDVLSASANDDTIAWYENVDGVATFGMPRVITTQAKRAQSVHAADVDGDGDIDVLSASKRDDKIAWYENMDGAGTFGSQQVITDLANEASSVYAVDLDGDGDADVLSASWSKTAWYENLDGKGEFGEQQVIAVTRSTPVHASDIDGDGDMDVLTANAWHENTDGKGTFSKRHTITENTSARTVYAADVDSDGDVDMISDTDETSIVWHENVDGKGTFRLARLITDAVDTVEAIHAADIDGDGDVDVLSASSGDSKIAWYENNDGREFGTTSGLVVADCGCEAYSADIDGDGDVDVLTRSRNKEIAWYVNTDGRGTFGSGNIIADGIADRGWLHVTDIDGDGDMDVLSAESAWEGGERVGAIAWYDNLDGKGTFSDQRVVSTHAAWRIHAADLDGDGDMDVVSTDWGDRKITWHENIDGKGTFGQQQVIDDRLVYYSSVYTADLDGDGDMDVLSGAEGWGDHRNEITWYENADGEGAFGSPQWIASPTYGPDSVRAADVDGDGDLDVLSVATGHHVGTAAWYENTDGSGMFGMRHVISTSPVDDDALLFVEDMDRDGDLDVFFSSGIDVSAGMTGPVWHQNLDGNGTFGVQQLLANSGWAREVADVDGDGFVDIIAIPRRSTSLQWYRSSETSDVFSRQQEISTGAAGTNSVHLSDLDGDGDLDVLAASDVDGELAWYANVDGMGTFGNQSLINNQLDYPSSVYATDLDGDGDPDVLSASENEVAWYGNRDGRGTFGAAQLISIGSVNPNWVSAADVDGDGDMDILLAYSSDGRITWHENVDGKGTFGTQQIIAANSAGRRAVNLVDLDGDSDVDLLTVGGWYENLDGKGSFEGPQAISGRVSFDTVYAADIDSDRDMDVVSTRGPVISWHENVEGTGLFHEHTMATVPGVRSVLVADLDHDGDLDVVVSALWGGGSPSFQTKWYENIDAKGTFGPPQLVATGLPTALHAADLDRDGDTDLVLPFDDKISWYENRLSGDADDDGQVVFADFLTLADNFGRTDAEWRDGDFDGDQTVTFADFLILSSNFGQSRPGPKPNSVSADHHAVESLGLNLDASVIDDLFGDDGDELVFQL